MIAAIEGELLGLNEGSALVKLEGGLTYEVLVPSFVSARLGASVGQPVAFHTISFIESQNQGVTMTPRLAGFLTVDERAFFELFTTVKGIGRRKALRAMTMDTRIIASAIADRDTKLLQSLPEIGKRTAETVVASLSGKVDRFVAADAFKPSAGGADDVAAVVPQAQISIAREALEALLQLGENRAAATELIERALRDEDDRPETTQQLVSKVYAMRAGS